MVYAITIKGSERLVMICATQEVAQQYLAGLERNSSTNRYHILPQKLVTDYVTEMTEGN